MISHCVFFKIKESSPFAEITTALQTLTHIPGVISATGGKTITTDRAGGYTYALTVVLAGKEELGAYSINSIHSKNG
jgi:hypothetical protein